MKNPDAWMEAEREAFRYLVSKTDSIEWQNAFLGRPPSGTTLNAWWMNSGGPSGVANPLPMAGTAVNIIAVFAEREKAMAWACMLSDCLPYTGGRLNYFGDFIRGEMTVPTLTPQEVEIREGRTAMLYRCEVRLFMAFDTRK